MADLSTAHGRAQAIANGGQEAELAVIVEAALETHLYALTYQVEHALDSIKVRPDELAQLDDQLTGLLGAVDGLDLLDEDAEHLRKLVRETFALSEAVSDHLEDVDRLITEAAQMLAP